MTERPTDQEGPRDPTRPPSSWQVALAYLGVSWAVIEAVALFTERYQLPAWLFTAAVTLLALGFVGLVIASVVRVPGDGDADTSPASSGRPPSATRSSWTRAGLTLLIVTAAWAIIATAWLIVSRGQAEALLTRNEVLGELERLQRLEHPDSAFELARAYVDEFGGDEAFDTAWNAVSWPAAFRPEPAGGQVWWRPLDHEEWIELGTAPLEQVRLPRQMIRVRYEVDGYEPFETLFNRRSGAFAPTLARVGSPQEGMTRIPGGEYRIPLPGLESLEPATPGDFWIDRREVTHADFAAFVEAGGYRDPAFWTEPFGEDGRRVPFDEAVARFVDESGLPGPSTWVGGRYPDGAANHPVTGISWYEAAAYARFREKRLPTIYHWSRAAGTGAAQYVLPRSNLDGAGPMDVAASDALGLNGMYDMGGNAREWVWNESDTGRFILGGGWNDAPYMFMDAYGQSPWDRSVTNGVRLATYDETPDDPIARSIDRPTRDFQAEEPISDAVFETYLSLFAYDDAPLNAEVVSSDDSSPDWHREVVAFDAAYGGERMQAVLFTPRGFEPPYQTVVVFPGSGALFQSSNDRVEPGALEFALRTGRAVMVPIYKGTYGRGGAVLLDTDQPNETVAYRDVVIQWVRDLGRALDYLETRDDIDSDKLAFHGYSWGGRMGPLMLAVHPRFQAAILYVAGLKHQRALPEADPASYVRRVTLPVLMLNGRYDHFFPLESSQVPLFELLGTPPEDKSHQVYDGGHNVPDPIRIRESIAWLDRYLGPTR